MFFGHYSGNLYYSPLVAFILDTFTNLSKKGINKVGLNEIVGILKNVNKTELIEILGGISGLNPSPIEKIEGDIILLNDFSHQYAVSPYADFASLEEANFVYLKQISERITSKLEKGTLIMPPESTLKALHDAAIASKGDNYEEEIKKAISLIGIGEVRRFGQNTRFQRVSDVVWKLEYEINGEIKPLLIIIEAKSGNAIYEFKEGKESEDMINTLVTFYKNDFASLEGIWIMILDSDKIPDSKGHGGFRGDEVLSKSFMQKMLIIHKNLLSAFGKPILVTAFAIKPFLEYYTYLYSVIKQNNLKNINALVEEFYMKGTLFFDEYRYIKTINDVEDIKRNLFVLNGR